MAMRALFWLVLLFAAAVAIAILAISTSARC